MPHHRYSGQEAAPAAQVKLLLDRDKSAYKSEMAVVYAWHLKPRERRTAAPLFCSVQQNHAVEDGDKARYSKQILKSYKREAEEKRREKA